MSVTHESGLARRTLDSLEERQWGWLPALRTALKNKQLLSSPICSTDEASFETSARIQRTAMIALDHKEALHTAAPEVGVDAMDGDIEHLIERLLYEAHRIQSLAQKVLP